MLGRKQSNAVAYGGLIRAGLARPDNPRIGSHLAEGGLGSWRRVMVAGGVTNRIGARAFSTLGGYAGRKRRNGVGFPMGNARPPSRFSSEMGRVTDAKQVGDGFCAYRRV